MSHEKGVLPPNELSTLPHVSPPPPRPGVGSDEHFAELMREIPTLWGNDPEIMHIRADEVLTGMLKALGFPKTVKVFDELEKWYS